MNSTMKLGRQLDLLRSRDLRLKKPPSMKVAMVTKRIPLSKQSMKIAGTEAQVTTAKRSMVLNLVES
tara:strand:- start:456 stop:656 length:201 start_codon:yes stop_codon:yes gene_type:complete